MKSRFEHDERANYLILSMENKEEKMADNMMLQNEIRGLLPVKIERINGCKEYYYDITSRHSLGSIVKKGSLDVQKIELLLCAIEGILEQFHEYMLEPDGICLSEELIYTTIPEWKLSFCYFEENGGRFVENLRKLLQYVIEYVDYQDKEAVALAYACYQAAMHENFTFAEIENCLFQTIGRRNGSVEDREQMNQIPAGEEKRNIAAENKGQKNGSAIRLVAEPQIQSEIMEEEAEESAFDEEKAKRISCCIIGAGIMVTGFLELAAKEGVFGDVPQFYILIGGVMLTLAAFGIWGAVKKKWKEETRLVTKEVVYPFDRESMEKDRRQQQRESMGGIYKEDKHIKDIYTGNRYTQNLYDGEIQTRCMQREEQIRFMQKEEQADCMQREKWADCMQREEKAKYIQKENRNGRQQTEDAHTDYEKTILLAYRAEETQRTLLSCQKAYPSIEITEYPFFIGKLPSLNHAVIAHEGISRMHCSIQREENRYSITDRNSTNGVIVNGVRLAPNETKELLLESEVILGTLRYIFR